MRCPLLACVLLVACGGNRDHHVQAHVTAADHPASCSVVGTFTVEGHPDVTLGGGANVWTSEDLPIAEGRAAAVSVGVANSRGAHDPACDVAVTCELRVDGVVVASEHGLQHVTCTTPLVGSR